MGPSESLKSVLGPEGSPWWNRFVKQIGFESTVKELWMI